MIKKLILATLCLSSFACSGSKGPPNIILLPNTLGIDAAQNRLFVADSEDNGFSLINIETNTIVTRKPLLNKDSALRLPELPQDLAVVNLGGDTTRIFVVGNGAAPRNRITVLDFDTAGGLRAAAFSPIIVGADDANDQGDLLPGLAVDTATGTLFVSNANDSLIRAYDVNTGAEKAGSPLAVNSTPSKISIENAAGRLCVSSLGSTSVSVIQTDDLTLAPLPFDTGIATGSVAAATTAAGTVLFALSPANNEIHIFKLDLADLTLSTPIGDPILPPVAGAPDSLQNLLSGAAAQVAAAPLADGRISAAVTQSTGDLGLIDVAADLSSFVTVRVPVLNGQGAQDLEILTDAAGNAVRVYFAAPGGSTVSFVGNNTNQFIGQIF